MIIRRFVTALRQQDWGLAALDFLIVVAGIFVGLQVDDWNEQRKAVNREAAIYTRLVADAATLVRQSKDYVNEHHEIAVASYELALAIETGDACGTEVLTAKRNINRFWDFPPPAFSFTTIDELVSSGQLNLLRDARMREQVAEIRESGRFVAQQWERYANDKRVQVYPLVTTAGLRVANTEVALEKRTAISKDARYVSMQQLCKDEHLIALAAGAADTQETYVSYLQDFDAELKEYASLLETVSSTE